MDAPLTLIGQEDYHGRDRGTLRLVEKSGVIAPWSHEHTPPASSSHPPKDRGTAPAPLTSLPGWPHNPHYVVLIAADRGVAPRNVKRVEAIAERQMDAAVNVELWG